MSSKPYIEIAPGVWSIKIVFVNIYMITTGLEEWVLVDTGFRGSAAKITAVAEELFGDMPPSAIILTHGHFDHAGNVKDLLKKWPVEVYAHPLELPYLTGLSDYPPADPTAGGGFLSLFHLPILTAHTTWSHISILYRKTGLYLICQTGVIYILLAIRPVISPCSGHQTGYWLQVMPL